MTNFEKYRKQILDFIANNKNSSPAIVNGKFAKCGDTDCSKCILDKEEYHELYCGNRMLLWLYEEYQEPSVDWSKVKEDTKIYVWNGIGKCKYPAYFKGLSDDGKIQAYKNGTTSWSSNGKYDEWDYAELVGE